jgi:hypothetical protein
MALRHRLDRGAPANITRSPGLRRLIDSAVERGWLTRVDFLVPSPGGSEPLCLLDFIAVSRNHIMHGTASAGSAGYNVALCPHHGRFVFDGRADEKLR